MTPEPSRQADDQKKQETNQHQSKKNWKEEQEESGLPGVHGR